VSAVTVAEVKAYLRLTHSSDDPLLQQLIDMAEDECLQYLDRDVLPNLDDPNSTTTTTDGELAQSVRGGIYLLVQALYEGVAPDDMIALRSRVQTMIAPYRQKLGV
jgi:hypothetical protein